MVSVTFRFEHQMFFHSLYCFFFRSGDISTLQVDAIVNSTNESLSESNPVSDKIFSRAGSQLKEELCSDIKGWLFIL